MAAISYLDFDLVVERKDQGYRARVISSPSGEATTDFVAPLSPLELENFQLRISRPRAAVRRVDTQEMASVKEVGGRLFAAVFSGEVQGCLRSSLDEAIRQDKTGLRVRLRLNDVPELAELPWEYLYNAGRNQFLALSARTPLVRYMDLSEAIRPLKVTPPVRVLSVISSPSDYPRLDVEREWEKLRTSVADIEAKGQLALERLDVATLSALQKRLRRADYHIFHFVGHGGFDVEGQDGFLLFTDEEGRGRRVSAQYLGTMLRDEGTLRLAVLNACEGARSSNQDPFAGTAQSLVQQGIPAVIAMQFEISDRAAIAFTEEFYAALADGYPVDAALADGRRAIFADGNEVEWGTPVLYMRSPDGQIFDVAPQTRTNAETKASPQREPETQAETPRPVVRPAAPAPTAEPIASTPQRVALESVARPSPPPVAGALANGLVRATYSSRVFAYLIDAAVLFALLVLIVAAFAYVPSTLELQLVAAAYFVIGWTRGQTLGMKALRIRVVKVDGSAVDPVTAVIRYIGLLIGEALVLGVLWPLWDPQQQAWHDKLARTYVVQADRSPQASPTRAQ